MRTRGQTSFKSATEKKICLHFYILPWKKKKEGKKKRERKAWNVLRLMSQPGNREWKGCLPYTELFFPSFSLATYYQNPPGCKASQELLDAPLLPNTSSPSVLLDTAGALCEPCFLWHDSRHCRSGHLDISIELDRCLLIGSTIHLGRAAWSCKRVHYNSVISPMQTVRCIIF